MFDWLLFIIIIFLCIPGLVIAIPQMVNAIHVAALKNGKSIPSKKFLWIIISVANVILNLGSAVLGTALSNKVGLQDQFFTALTTNQNDLWHLIFIQIKAG